jgi:hypothetical protein
MPVFNPKKSFTLTGQNINFTERVFFGQEEVEELFYLGSTGVSGEVPAAAMTDEIFVQVNQGLLNIGEQNIILDSSSQVLVSGLIPSSVSGAAGDILQLSGENFHQITNVNFGTGIGKTAQFSVLSDNLIEVVVPTGATYDEVTVFSSLRTGVNGNTSLASGKTYNKFVPIPILTGTNSIQLKAGEDFIVGGQALSGVTGISVNTIDFNNFRSLGSTGAVAEVPTGVQVGGHVFTIPKGPIDLLMASGGSHQANSNFSFRPLAEIVSVSVGNTTGSIMTISGNNFNSGLFYTGQGNGDGCLVSVGGNTGNFKITTDAGGYNRLTGVVPTGLKMGISGGNVAVGDAVINKHSVSLFTEDYPEQYPSTVLFSPGIGSPSISRLTPNSGVGRTSVIIEGNDLFGITGINFRGGNVGVGTEFLDNSVVGVVPGKSIMATIPDTSNFATGGGFLDLDLSGFYGTVSKESGFFVQSIPRIHTVVPGTGEGVILPGSSGTIYGEGFYSGTVIKLYGGDGTLSTQNFQQDLSVSGYSSNYDQLTFYYPNSFETGNFYGLRVENDRAGTSLYRFTGYIQPVISGFSTLSGVQGETVTVSGFFDELNTSGIKIGDKVVEDFTKVGTTGITFTIPKKTTTNLVSISTSGGSVFSTDLLNITPAKPSISGYYIQQTGQRPNTFNSSDQVFAPTNIINVTGESLNLTTGIFFTGQSMNSEFSLNNFISKSPSNISFSLPTGVNVESGNFIIKDFLNRETSSSFPINVVRVSGFNNDLLPNQLLNISGHNITGLDLRFPDLTGGFKKPEVVVNATSGSLDVLSVRVPSGIVNGNVLISGRHNPAVGELFEFYPLPVVSGVTGFNSSYEAQTGNIISITGVNFNSNLFGSGSEFISISGTGNNISQAQVQQYEVINISTGVGIGTTSTDTLYSKIDFRLDNSFIGTGQFFIAEEDNYDFSQEQISFFPQSYVINGTRVNVTGYGPLRGVTGSNVELTGEGLDLVTGVFFKIPSGDALNSSFTINSSTKITATVPEEGIEARGMANILLSGGTNQDIGQFEMILDASVVEFNIVEENDTPASSTRVGNFTQKETINGTVFLVTRTRFPDGTTAIISSTPQA